MEKTENIDYFDKGRKIQKAIDEIFLLGNKADSCLECLDLGLPNEKISKIIGIPFQNLGELITNLHESYLRAKTYIPKDFNENPLYEEFRRELQNNILGFDVRHRKLCEYGVPELKKQNAKTSTAK